MKKNILIFPCGSEIALEIYRSVNNSTHFNIFGASSVCDHGKFVYENYIGDVPYIDSPDFIESIKKTVKKFGIDFIYPAMDSVITKLKNYEDEIGCTIIASPADTCKICLSKELTYRFLEGKIKTPKVFDCEAVDKFPVFGKPKIGYGSRGIKKINNQEELLLFLKECNDSIITEYLPGDEYTVDCFTGRDGKLLFCGPRKRNRISNGISVNTFSVEDNENKFGSIADKINQSLKFRGAWFFQAKLNSKNEPVLLEIASRLGGSSALYRAQGINFAQLSLFDAMGYDISILRNNYRVEMDRALDNKYKLDINYDEVYVDYDDTIILEKTQYNTDVIKFICQCKNNGIKITLLSSHEGDLNEAINHFGIANLFDRVIHISKAQNKSVYIDNSNSIFIDDSFAERKRVKEVHNIPVFSVDMVECLLK